MSQVYQYNILNSVQDGLALTQQVAQNAQVNLNGASQLLSDGVLARSITIHSSDDIQTCIFVVVGTQNGIEITENLTGVNNSIVNSVNYYDSIISITATVAAATNITIGTGLNAYVGSIPLNTQQNKGVVSYTVSVTLDSDAPLPVASTLTCNVLGSLRPYHLGRVYDNQYNKINADSNRIVQSNIACHNIVIQVMNIDINAGVVVRFLQV